MAASHGLSTQCVAPELPSRVLGSATTPIFQTTTFLHLDDSGAFSSDRYTRCQNNPTQVAAAAKVAQLEGAEAAVTTSSGMAAISSALMAVLGPGDHLLVQPSLYGGTVAVLAHMAGWAGIQVTPLDAAGPSAWPAQVQPNTKAVHVETISNPTCDVLDLDAVVALAKQHGLVSIIDNTFASPINYRPLLHGFDLVAESATKYMNGHSDVICGAVAGSAALIAKVLHNTTIYGGVMDPHAAFLLMRGMKTLALRVARHNANAMALAMALEAHPQVTRVLYPGLASHPSHSVAARLFLAGMGKAATQQPLENGHGHGVADKRTSYSGFGGVLSFEVAGGLPAAMKVLQSLKTAFVGPSLGGVETLVTLPAQSSHRDVDVETRAALGITDGLIRVAVGIEDEEDLIHDFMQAIDSTTM